MLKYEPYLTLCWSITNHLEGCTSLCLLHFPIYNKSPCHNLIISMEHEESKLCSNVQSQPFFELSSSHLFIYHHIWSISRYLCKLWCIFSHCHVSLNQVYKFNSFLSSDGLWKVVRQKQLLKLYPSHLKYIMSSLDHILPTIHFILQHERG